MPRFPFGKKCEVLPRLIWIRNEDCSTPFFNLSDTMGGGLSPLGLHQSCIFMNSLCRFSQKVPPPLFFFFFFNRTLNLHWVMYMICDFKTKAKPDYSSYHGTAYQPTLCISFRFKEHGSLCSTDVAGVFGVTSSAAFCLILVVSQSVTSVRVPEHTTVLILDE